MNLKYACPSCGTPLGYQGLCWKCKCEQERQAALAWTLEQIAEKQRDGEPEDKLHGRTARHFFCHTENFTPLREK